MRFEPGSTVVLQDVYRQRLWSARPMTVGRPDPHWSLPTLPEDWDVVEEI